MSEGGTSFMKLCNRKIASGSANIECEIHTGQNEPDSPQMLYCVSSGMRVTWRGTIWSANTATNRMSRALKSIQAKAYAASSAIEIGMTTEGKVTTIVLTK